MFLLREHHLRDIPFQDSYIPGSTGGMLIKGVDMLRPAPKLN